MRRGGRLEVGVNCLTGWVSTTTNADNKRRDCMLRDTEEKRRDAGAVRLARVASPASGLRVPWLRLVDWLWVGGVMVGSVWGVSGADWESTKNRFNLNTHIGFNIKANFEHLGGMAGSNAGPDLRGTDHFYDDGYNRVDAAGNAGGQTQFWGYENAGQVTEDQIVMSSYSSSGMGRIDEVTDAPHWGAELTYARELGWNGSYWWGVEMGLSWTLLSFKEQATTQGDATLLRDTYALNGVMPPGAPYAGTFGGGGPLLSDDPQRTFQTLSGGAQTMGKYELDGSMYVLRVGLVYETPFTSWLTLQFGGGVAGGLVESEFSFEESTNLVGVRQVVTRGSDRSEDFVGGAYAQAGMALHFHENFMGSLGLQYKYLTSFSQEVAGRRAELDFTSSMYLAVGLGVTF
jgi:hypothetical protein